MATFATTSIDTPNDIEIAGVNYFWQENRRLYSEGAKLVTHEVNRVQDKHPNAFHEGWTTERCNALFREGYRLDWKCLRGISQDMPWIRPELFAVTCPRELPAP